MAHLSLALLGSLQIRLDGAPVSGLESDKVRGLLAYLALEGERLHRRALQALAQLADYHERRGEYAQAQQYAWRQLDLDPWREASHRQLMRVLALSGQRSAALMQYATCRRILAAELGVEPEA